MSGNIFYSNANRLHVGAAAASAAKTSDVIKEWLPTQEQSTVVATVLWNLAALGFVLNAGLLLRYLKTKWYLLPLPPPAIVVNLCGINLLLVFGVLLATATLTLDLGDSGIRAGQAQLFFTVCVLLQSWLGQVMLVYCTTWLRHDSAGATRENSERSGNKPVGGIFNSLRPNSRRRRRKLGHLRSSELSDERQQDDGVRMEFGGVRMQGTATCKESGSKEPLTSATMLAMTSKQNKVVKWWLVWSWLLSLLAATALLMTIPSNSQDVCLTLDPFRRKYQVTGVDVQHLKVMENGVLKVPLMLVLVPVYVLGIAVVIRSAVQRAKSPSGSGLGLNQHCPHDESSANDDDDDDDKGGARAFYVVNRFNRRKLGGGIDDCDVNRDSASWNVNLNALRAVRYPKACDSKKGPENHLSRSVHGPGQADSVQQRGMRLMVAESDCTAHLSQLTSRDQQMIQEENPTDASNKNKNKNSRQIFPLTTNVEHNNVRDSERTDNSDKQKEKQSPHSSKNKPFRADTIDKDEATHMTLLSINSEDDGESVVLPFADEADNDAVESETFDTASSSEYYNITKLATGDDDDESDAETERLASNIATLSKTHNMKLATEGLFFDDTVDLDLFDTDEYAIYFNESELDIMPPGHHEVRAQYIPDSFRRASIYSEEERPVREDIKAYTDHVLYIPSPQGSNVIADQLTHYQDCVQDDLYESPVEAFSVAADKEVSVQEPVSSGTATKSSNDMEARPESAVTYVESSRNKREGFKRVSFTDTDGIHRFEPNSAAAATIARAHGQRSKGNAIRPIANSRTDSTKAGQNSQEVDQLDIARHASGRGSGDSYQDIKQGTKAVKIGMAQPALKVSTASPKKASKTRVAESQEEKNTFGGKLRVHSPTVAENCREGSNRSRAYVVSRKGHFQPCTKHVNQPQITELELTGQPTVARLTPSPIGISDDDSRLILTEDRQQFFNLNNSANKHRSKAHTSEENAPGAQLEEDVKVGEHPNKDLLASGVDPFSIDDRDRGSGACEGRGETEDNGRGGADSHTKMMSNNMNSFGVTQPLQQPSSAARTYGYPNYSRFQRPSHPEYPEYFPKTRSGAARLRLSTHFTHQCPKGAIGEQEKRKQLAQDKTKDNDVVSQREVATSTQTTASQGPSGLRQEKKSRLNPRHTASQAGIKKREQHSMNETPTSSNGQTDSKPPGDLTAPALHHSSLKHLASQQPTPLQQPDLGESLYARDSVRDALAGVGDGSRRPPAKLSGTSFAKEGREFQESRHLPGSRTQGAGDGDTGVTEVERGKRLTGRAALKNLNNKGKERSFWWKRVACCRGCGYEWKCVVGLLLHVLLCLPFVVSLAPGVWEGRDCGVRLQVLLTVRLLLFCQVVACPLWLLSFHGRALLKEK